MTRTDQLRSTIERPADLPCCPACGAALHTHAQCLLCRCLIHKNAQCRYDALLCRDCDAALARCGVRRCTGCGKIKPLSCFQHTPTGGRCRKCGACKKRRQRETRGPALREYLRRYRATLTPTQRAAYNATKRAWKRRNADKVRASEQRGTERHGSWRRQNPERAAARDRAYRARNRARVLAADRARYQRDKLKAWFGSPAGRAG